MYERPAVAGRVLPDPPGAPPAEAEGHEPSEPPPARARVRHLPPNGVALAWVAAGLILFTFVGSRGGFKHLGVVTFPAAAVLLAMAFARRSHRLRPDEPWLPRFILLGVYVKIAAAGARYFTLTEVYQSAGDAFVYDREGREFVKFWTGDPSQPASPLDGLELTGSNIIRWLTGVVYYLFGQNLLAAFFLFGLLAVIGSYFWYRALVDSVPYVDKRLFLAFMLFVPSIVFWPASLGKEALMQVGLGAMAWATSLALQGRLARAVPLAVGGGLLVYIIRPHLLALVTVAAAVPYFIGHMRRDNPKALSARPVGMVVLGLLVIFTVTAGLRFVGLENLSIDSVEEQLDVQTESTSYGGSTYSHPGNSLTNPLFLPMGFVTVLFRPFIWESPSLFQMLAAVESAVLLGLFIHRFPSIRLALRRCRREPFLLYCITLLLLYSVTFSSLANFGLLTRQRSLVLPAMYALIAIDPRRFRRQAEGDGGVAAATLSSQALERAAARSVLVPAQRARSGQDTDDHRAFGGNGTVRPNGASNDQ